MEGNMGCTGCGFDEGKNYLQYLTLVKIPEDVLGMAGLTIKGQKKETEIVIEKTDSPSSLSVDVLEGSFAFDSLRYLRESIEPLYIEAMKNYTDGKYEDAFGMFMRTYENGNILAGLKLAQMYYWGEGCEKSYEKALQLFIAGKNYGYPLALSWLSECYRLGHGMPKDLQTSKKLHSLAEPSLAEMCACGDRDAQYYYGYDLLYGGNCKEDDDKAFYWLNKAASGIHNRAGVELAKCYLNGWGCEKNSQKAITLLEQYVERSYFKAHYELGRLYYYGKHMDRDYSHAFRLFKFAADHEHGAARFYLGECYYYGRGVDKDYQEARRWYEKSAAAGNKYAVEALGVMYLTGRGVPKNEHKAKVYFKASADKGLALSQYMLAQLYLSRSNFENNELGRAYLEKAANQGFIDAQKLLARCYVSGYGFDDVQKCYEWFLKAANQEDPEAERIMGYMYICYFVVPFSYEKAVEWFERAKLHGDVIAQIKLAECYMNGNGVTKDMSVGLDMLRDAETKIAADDGDAQELIADAFYDVDVQKSFDYYCIAYANGKKSAIYDLAWLFFVNNKENNIYKNENKQQLLDALIEAEKDSESPEIALLLGKIFVEGRRGLSDSKRAESWYLAAYNKGSMKAACGLAEIYHQQGDFLSAFRFASKAHEGDFAEGTFLLGYYYKKGIGVKKNRSKAKALLKTAAGKGVKAAEGELKKFIF